MIEQQARKLVTEWGFNPDDYPELLQHAVFSCSLKGKRIGEVAQALGLLDATKTEQILKSKPKNIFTLDFLAEKVQGIRGETQKILALHYGYPFFDEIPQNLIHPAMESGAARKRCDEFNSVLLKAPSGKSLLLFADYGTLTAFLQEGRKQKQEDPLRLAGGGQIQVGLANASQILKAGRHQVDAPAFDVLSNIHDNVWSGGSAKTEGERVLARILDNAISRGATDVQLAPRRDGTSHVFIRVYGDMAEPDRHSRLDVEFTKEITRFLVSKSRAGDGGRMRKPADGQMTYKNANAEVFIRCSFIPADRFGLDHDMISVSLRLLPREARQIRLTDLGLPESVWEESQKALLRSQGLILIAGPTNSGKSTTISGLVGEHVKMYGRSKKRLSIEDPVERYLEGITQITVENNFYDLMKHILRHDPDMVWVGEIRDNYSASACVRAATSGHLVMSTVHANDSLLAFRAVANYLIGVASSDVLGATVFDLAESLSLVVAQRLVKKLCPKCKQPHKPTEQEIWLLADYLKKEGLGYTDAALNHELGRADVFKARDGGCEACAHSGYSGETPIAEVFPVSRAVRTLLGASDNKINVEDLIPYRKNTLFESAFQRMIEGVVEYKALFI